MAKLLSGTRVYGNLTVDTFATVTGNITTGNILTDGYFFANGAPFTGGGGAGNLVVYARSGTVNIPIVDGFLEVVGRSGNISIPIAT